MGSRRSVLVRVAKVGNRLEEMGVRAALAASVLWLASGCGARPSAGADASAGGAKSLVDNLKSMLPKPKAKAA